MDTKVTFVSEPLVGMTAQAFPDHTEIGAQYVAEVDGTTVYAIVWAYEPSEKFVLYNPVDAWRVIDNLPAAALTLDFDRALPTLADAFGLHIPCLQGS